jgi:hypothetical protein
MADSHTPETVETVDLSEEAADQIAEKAAGLVSSEVGELKAQIAELTKAMSTPVRREVEPEGVPAPKPSEAGPVYGGDDQYTLTGNGHAEVATNLWLANKILGIKGAHLSSRGHEVMVKSAEASLKSAPAPISAPGQSDKGLFVKGEYATMRADAYKAMTSTAGGSGDEWVPTLSSAELWRDMHLATSVSAQIPRVNMPSNPYTLPTLSADMTFYYASSENTAVTASNPTTAAATLTAKKIMAEVDFSGELTEDSIIPIVPELRANLVRRGAQVMDDLIVHGDTETGGTGNVNTDDGAPGSGAFYLALNGLRKFCLVTNTGQVKQFAGAPTMTLFNGARALLGKYGALPSDLLFISGVSTITAFQDLAQFQTLEKYGPQATILTGELGKIANIPVVLSEAIPGASTDKVDDDGKYTVTSVATNDTDGWFVLVNKSQWKQGFRRDLQIESFRDIQKDQNILVASFRMALIPSGIATTHTAVGYDITVL